MTSQPVPESDPASAQFFAALDEGRLDLLRCRQCGTAHLAALVCDACNGTVFAPEPASGAGTIFSFTRTYIAHHPAFADRLPYCGGIVELAEGPRLFAPLLGDVPFAVGAAVAFEPQRAEGRGIAAFRLATSG
ncbi:MAG: OB-fold domain-containing protein [Sphingopyxis sp.]|uniref:Zn-ribbon domain-containing OB-fold protein n=1 Tax=Sphingopyxis sp. TaxID=1908224 RepID=UPI001A33AFFB|nr:OB-fold domain-containing protein [Sphingopyxis sp.]MBJ7499335.1 OB-fold domain-containing protein [Sphingopyxis sp.]